MCSDSDFLEAVFMTRFEKKVVLERCHRFNDMLRYINSNKKELCYALFFEFLDLQE